VPASITQQLFPGGDGPGMTPRIPAGMGTISGEWRTHETMRKTGMGYVSIRYQERFTSIIGHLAIQTRVAEHESAQSILEDARSRAPVWKGESYTDQYGVHGGILRDSLYLAELENEDGWAVASDVHYAPYVEFGTSNPAYPQQPFLIPALEANKESSIARTAAGVAVACR
jgi:HK97 gp10 family phage protein